MKTRDNFQFEFSGEQFRGLYSAQTFLKAHGFSYGSVQRDAPIGILFGDCIIAKWRNLSDADRSCLHGTITGIMREGPVVVSIFFSAPDVALDAIFKSVAQ